MTSAEWQARYAHAAPQAKRVLLSLARRLPWPERSQAYQAMLLDPDLRTEVAEFIRTDPIARSYGDE